MTKKRSSKQKDPAEKIATLLAKVEDKLGENTKCTISEYVRLLQALHEFDRETPRDIEVTWVETIKGTSDSDE